ncbi:MAG: CoA-binding protein [Balneolaceae bacterium]|nr:CoA-binding protein [Balneolaceae bacterium]
MLKNAAEAFLKLKRVAIAGVSSSGDVAANIIYRNLKKHGYTVYAVNPNSRIVEGDTCYPSIASVPETPDWVVIATHPDVTPLIIDECIEQKIKKVWIHKSLGNGSYNPDAIKKAEDAGISLIPGSCPMMFLKPVDPVHKCMKWFFKISGKEANPDYAPRNLVVHKAKRKW